MVFYPHIMAFGWTDPAMLGWLAAAAAPLVIHLLARRPRRRTDWAAMRFLLAAARQTRRRRRLEHLTLLATRTLLIALVVLAVADPYRESGGLFHAADAVRTHRVFVIDASYSMDYSPNEQSRFEEVKSLAADLARACTAGDRFSLVIAGHPTRLIGQSAVELSPFLHRLNAAEPTDGSFDMAAALDAAGGAIDIARREWPKLEKQEIYLMGDLCRVGWMPADKPQADEILRRAERLARSARLVVVDVGLAGAENTAIVRLQNVDPLVLAGKPVEIEVALRHFGIRTRKNETETVELLIDGRSVDRQILDLPAGQTAAVRFSVPFDTPGERVVEARIASDQLALDNRRWLVLPVGRTPRVLCVDGRHGDVRLGGACDYLVEVLSARDDGQPAFHATVISENRLLELDLSEYQCICLCDVARPMVSEVRRLADYVRDGGGLIIFLGDRVSTDYYNRELLEKERLLPARLEDLVARGSQGLDPLGYNHPIVRPFRGREKVGLTSTLVDKYFKLAPISSSPSGVVLATREGDPLIVEQTVGQGRVVLAATTADASWTSLPLGMSYVPLVRRMVAYAAAGRGARRNTTVGRPLVGPLPSTFSGHITLPDGQQRPLSSPGIGDPRRWTFDGDDHCGVYTVIFDALKPGRASESRFAVNLDTTESDLDKINQRQLRDDVLPGVALEYRTARQASVESAAEPAGPRGRLSGWLLLGALVLLLIDMLLARRFGGREAYP